MDTASLWHKAGLALILGAGTLAAQAQGGITSPPNKNSGATSQPATGTTPTVTVTGPSTISVAPKKTHKALAKAKAASAAASK
jgi:hypothetical protein